ncbi:MAG: hypothetical protein U9Q29_01540 [Campylobacterota bacterium]|nr:hypothetical protein [Campylobacterota bacterium]
MFKKLLFLVLVFPHAMMAEVDFRVENTNITIDENHLYNYDRLRFYTDYTQDNFFGTFIVDSVNYYGHNYINSNDFNYLKLSKSDTLFLTQSNFYNYYEGSIYAKLYRAYVGYEDDKNRVVAGLLNITMGVGRIWNPTNLFNPKNIYALEPDEVFGVTGISYTRDIDETSHIKVVVSQKADHSFKYSGQYRTFLEFGDIGVDLVSSDDTKMVGYEIEANLADTGVEVRSEGAYIKSTLKNAEDIEFFQGIVGADYGFVNGITLIAEALYSSETFSYEEIMLNFESEIVQNMVHSNFYTALSISYSFNIFLDASLTYIESFNDSNARFISPTLTYTLNDYNSFSVPK